MSPVPVTTVNGFPEYPIVAEVRDGPPSFTVVNWPGSEIDGMREEVQRRLGPLYPQRQITVDVGDVPARGGELACAIARAIHIDHTY